GIDAAAPQGPFDFVSLLIGVNNQYRGRPLDEYRVQFHALLQRAIGFAGGRPGRVLVLSFPDWGATPFGIGSGRDLAAIEIETDEFNAAAEVICTQQGGAFVDITDISRDHGGDPAMIADDGLHPSARMYALWSARALPVAAHLLGGTD
ncbi:SGNH/GDSL hydrolase family protein, partial [Corallococcus carmarthensis]|nr:SGNH/GDSL hydrolase family protein [Corallococcus carmarthensis]